MKARLSIACIFGMFFLFTACKAKEAPRFADVELIHDDLETVSGELKNGKGFNFDLANLGYKNVFDAHTANSNYIAIDDKNYPIDKMYLDGTVSPIGWSKNGHFAYAQFYIEEYDKDPHCLVQIINIIDDENVVYFDNDNMGEWGHMYENISFAEFWEKYNEEIISKLTNYEIISYSNIELTDINALQEKYSLVILLEDTEPRTSNNDGWGSPIIWQGKNVVIANGKNRKKIITQTDEINIKNKNIYGEGEYLEIDFVGYYTYPYGDRMLLYFLDKRFYPAYDEMKYYGTENPRHLAGCHLTAGFE